MGFFIDHFKKDRFEKVTINKAIGIASKLIKIDSLRNCFTNINRFAPTTLRIPISLAREEDLAIVN